MCRRGTSEAARWAMLKFRCGQCNQKIGVPEAYAGRLVRCPRCSQPARVPQPDQVGEAGASSAPVDAPPPAASPPASEPAQVAATTAPAINPEPILAKKSSEDYSSVFGDWPTSVSEQSDAPPAVQTPPAVESSPQGSFSHEPAGPEVESGPAPVSVETEETEVIDAPVRRQEPQPDSTGEVADLLRRLHSDATAEWQEESPVESETDERSIDARAVPSVSAPAAPVEGDAAGRTGAWVVLLGLLSEVAGLGALGLYWMPATSRLALPVAGAGLALGAAGVLISVVRGAAGLVLPAGGTVISAAAVAIAGLGMYGMLPIGNGPGGGAGPPRRAFSLAAGADSELPTPLARSGNVEVRVASALVVQPAVYSGDVSTLQTAPLKYLQITLELRNVGDSGPFDYRPWSRQESSNGDSASLADAEGTTLKRIDLSPMMPFGAVREPSTALYPHGPRVSDVLLFEVPPAQSGDLELQLPGTNVALPGSTLRIRIPADVIQR